MSLLGIHFRMIGFLLKEGKKELYYYNLIRDSSDMGTSGEYKAIGIVHDVYDFEWHGWNLSHDTVASLISLKNKTRRQNIIDELIIIPPFFANSTDEYIMLPTPEIIKKQEILELSITIL